MEIIDFASVPRGKYSPTTWFESEFLGRGWKRPDL